MKDEKYRHIITTFDKKMELIGQTAKKSIRVKCPICALKIVGASWFNHYNSKRCYNKYKFKT